MENLSPEVNWQQAYQKLQQIIQASIPSGFSFGEQFGMDSWFVPLTDYPAGYHCQPSQPLPFVSISLKKSHIAIYHMGLYASPELTEWFEHGFAEATGKKPDMGKSCIRFKKPGEIPFDFISTLMQKMSPVEWITLYESAFLKKK